MATLPCHPSVGASTQGTASPPWGSGCGQARGVPSLLSPCMASLYLPPAAWAAGQDESPQCSQGCRGGGDPQGYLKCLHFPLCEF